MSRKIWKYPTLFAILISIVILLVYALKLYSFFSHKRQEKGFSLIELLVVMGITGILMGMGFNAFIQFRKSRQVDTVAYTVRDMIKGARGKAMSVSTNSTAAGGVWPVATSVTIDADHVRANVIHDHGLSTSYAPWTGIEGKIKTYDISEIFPVEVKLNQCDKVVFESVNGTMHIYQSGSEVQQCEIEFSLPGYSRTLQLNANTKQFEVI